MADLTREEVEVILENLRVYKEKIAAEEAKAREEEEEAARLEALNGNESSENESAEEEPEINETADSFRSLNPTARSPGPLPA